MSVFDNFPKWDYPPKKPEQKQPTPTEKPPEAKRPEHQPNQGQRKWPQR